MICAVRRHGIQKDCRREEHPLPSQARRGNRSSNGRKSGNGAHSAKGSKVSSFYVGGPVTLYVCLYWYSGIDSAIDC